MPTLDMQHQDSLRQDIQYLALRDTTSTQNNNDDSRLQEPRQKAMVDSAKNTNNTQLLQYLTGDIDLLSKDAKDSVTSISSELFNKTKFQVFIHIIKNPIVNAQVQTNQLSLTERFQVRRNYEEQWLHNLQGNYAVIFLFYNDHAITIRTNGDFLKTQDLLEDYAYPYLPAESVSNEKYNNGVNQGLSNLYLALVHKVAEHYKIVLNFPKPMEKPSGVTKVVIYVMLAILIGLFVLVSNGFFKQKGKQ